MAHHWVATSTSRELPRFAVRGGATSDGKPSYVGRCYHEGNWLPANVRDGNGGAFFSWAKEFHNTDEYEILVGPGYGWAPWEYGGVPRTAVSSGNCSKGEPLYIGRGHCEDGLYVGKVEVSYNLMYIPYEFKDVVIEEYEVLVQAPPDVWLPASLENPPADAVLAGKNSNGTAIYVARAMHDDVMLPANYIPDRREAFVASYDCSVHRKQEIEVLCGPNYTWLQPHSKDLPSSTIFTNRLHNGEPMCVGRAKYKGSLTPGLVAADGSCVIIPFGEAAVRVENYEVLIKHHP